MMNMDNIFDLFGSNDNLDGTENSTTLIDFKNTPTYWIGMYKKFIFNHINFNLKMIKFFKQSNTDLDVSDMKDAGEFVAYNRAWAYIKKIDLTNESHINSINLYANKKLDKALQSGIDFFYKQNNMKDVPTFKKF